MLDVLFFYKHKRYLFI